MSGLAWKCPYITPAPDWAHRDSGLTNGTGANPAGGGEDTGLPGRHAGSATAAALKEPAQRREESPERMTAAGQLVLPSICLARRQVTAAELIAR